MLRRVLTLAAVVKLVLLSATAVHASEDAAAEKQPPEGTAPTNAECVRTKHHGFGSKCPNPSMHAPVNGIRVSFVSVVLLVLHVLRGDTLEPYSVREVVVCW